MRIITRQLASTERALETFDFIVLGSGGKLGLNLLSCGHFPHPQRGAEELSGKLLAERILGPKAPHAERSARLLDAHILQLLSGRKHRRQNRQGGIPQLATVLIRRLDLCLITTPRGHIAGSAVKEHTERTTGL